MGFRQITPHRNVRKEGSQCVKRDGRGDFGGSENYNFGNFWNNCRSYIGAFQNGVIITELRVLRYFLAVVREESITRAAEILHITQPTLSRQLAALEEDLGVRLFNRGAHGITLTNEGVLLRRRAEEIAALVDKTERELLEQDEFVDGVVSICAGELASVQLLAEIIRSAHERYPLMRFEILTASADVTKERIDKGLTDIGLLLEPVDLEKYEYIRLGVKERCVVMMRPDDPLAERDFIRREDLCGTPLILPLREKVRGELMSWFGDLLDPSDIIITGNMSTNNSIMVLNGLGRCITIEGSIPHRDRAMLVSRPLFPELTATSVLAWKRGQPFSLAAEKFIERIKCFLGMDTQ